MIDQRLCLPGNGDRFGRCLRGAAGSRTLHERGQERLLRSCPETTKGSSLSTAALIGFPELLLEPLGDVDEDHDNEVIDDSDEDEGFEGTVGECLH